jgi:hypothetical protein
VASAAVVMTQSSGVPAVAGVLLVGLTGLFVAGLLAALLMFLSWAVRRSQRGRGRLRKIAVLDDCIGVAPDLAHSVTWT